MSDPKAALRAVGGITPDSNGRLPNIPSFPFSDNPSANSFNAAVKSWLEAAMGKGLTGFATKQDLFDIGAIAAMPDGSYGPVRAPNAAIPPKPTHVTAVGAFTNMILEWDDPNKAYGNHAYAEIWAAETDNFTTASMIGEAPSFMFAHAVGEGSTRYYWIRFVSTSDVKGPFQSVGGILGQTAPPVEFLMDTLSGEYGNQPYFDVPEATVIDGVTIPAGRYMKSAFIVNGAITNAKIKNAAIDSAKIADLSVVRAKIADAAIDSAKIADAAIDSAKIADAAITTAKIRDAAINSAKIADASIGSAKIVDAAITNAKIGNAEIGTLKIAAGAITLSAASIVDAGHEFSGGFAADWQYWCPPVYLYAAPSDGYQSVVVAITAYRYGSIYSDPSDPIKISLARNGVVVAQLSAQNNTATFVDFPPPGEVYYQAILRSTTEYMTLYGYIHYDASVSTALLGAYR
jgi:hypothetical protein